MRRFALVVLLVLGACARVPGADTGSGARGVVLLGPQCPVQQRDSPCPDVPWVGTVRAVGEGVDVETETDATGRFEMRLEPGTYVVRAVVAGGGPPTAVPATVTVREGAFTDVTLQVDTGIR